MPIFEIQDDVVELISRAVHPKPFESMSGALGRYFRAQQVANAPTRRDRTAEELLAELDALPDAEVPVRLPNYERKRPRMKAPSPEPMDWARQISELRSLPGLGSWKALCEHFDVDTNGDSARRRLQKWVAARHPEWPEVPDV
jgi:hypothetical protein